MYKRGRKKSLNNFFQLVSESPFTSSPEGLIPQLQPGFCPKNIRAHGDIIIIIITSIIVIIIIDMITNIVVIVVVFVAFHLLLNN